MARHFNGELYVLRTTHHSKKGAQREAEEFKNRGYKTRIIKGDNGFIIWDLYIRKGK